MTPHNVSRRLTGVLAFVLVLQGLLCGLTRAVPLAAAEGGRDLAPLVTNGTIIDHVDHTFVDADGQPVADTAVTTASNLALTYHWSLPNGLVQPGDYFRFTLPTEVPPFTADGDLLSTTDQPLGHFTVQGGEVTLTFTQEAVGLSDLAGDFHLTSTGLSFDETGNHEILVPVSQDKVVSVPVTVKPAHVADLTKTGQQVGTSANIDWTLNVNAGLKHLVNGHLDEQLPASLALTGVAIQVADVLPDGSLHATGTTLEEGRDFRVADHQIYLQGNYAATDHAFLVTIHTRLADPTQTYNYQQIENRAALYYDGQADPNPPTVGGQVTMNYRPHEMLTKVFAGGSGERYNWTVTYNEPGTSLPVNTTLIDTPGPGQAFTQRDGDVRISLAGWDTATDLSPREPLVQGRDYQIDYADSRLRVTLLRAIDQPLILTYAVVVANPSTGQQLINDVEDNHGHHAHGEGTINVATGPNLTKTQTGADDAGHTVDWAVDLNPQHQQLVNYTLADTLFGRTSDNRYLDVAPISLVDATLRLTDLDTGQQLVAGRDFELTHAATTPQFNLALIGAYGETYAHLRLTYTTRYDQDAVNTAWVNRVDGPDLTATAEYNPPPTITNTDNKNGFWLQARGQLRWEVTVNTDYQRLAAASVTDAIPADQTFVDALVLTQDTNGSYSLPVTTGIAIDQPDTGNNQVLTVYLPEGSTQSYQVVVLTRLSDPLAQKNYKNTATYTNGGEPETLPSNPVWPGNAGTIIAKTGQQDSSNQAQVNWSVRVNDANAHLKNAVVTDVASPNQRVDLASLQIYPFQYDDANNNNGTTQVDYEHPLTRGRDYTAIAKIDGPTGETTTTITFLHELTQPYVIDYAATIDSDAPVAELTNGVRIDADRVTQDKTDQPTKVQVTTVGGSANGVSGSLELTKQDAATGSQLAGAEFALTAVATNATRTVTTDASGHARWANLRAGRYRLVEVKAPTGYQIAPEYTGEGRELDLTFTQDHPTVTLTVQNSRILLPHTGGWQRGALLALGLLLWAAMGLGLWHRSRKEVA
ncbi:collagen binding domain-containing protein [Lacticaseibacillus parakribbianus]|uniref:collagen binding domain-containing protein n=1 Tax=Lacticaseibacillus parakribbianus TaxID=2970927 RepID=UPI0021CB1135|nr:collagen binding domain-containing protein [Lacticaseibacillus parakribbianus]